MGKTGKLEARRTALAKLLRLAYEMGRDDEHEHPGAECLRDFAGDAAKLTERELSE